MEADHDGAICDKENAQLDTSVFIQAVAVLPGSASTGVWSAVHQSSNTCLSIF